MTFRSSGCLQNSNWGSAVTPQAAQMIYSVLSCECRGKEKETSRKSFERMPSPPHTHTSFIFTTFSDLIWSDVKSQIGPSSLAPVYITELIKERMVIKKWWSGRGLWQEKLILFNKKDGGWGKKELQKETYWGKEARQWGSKTQSCCIYYSLSRMACTNTEDSTEALDLGI